MKWLLVVCQRKHHLISLFPMVHQKLETRLKTHWMLNDLCNIRVRMTDICRVFLICLAWRCFHAVSCSVLSTTQQNGGYFYPYFTNEVAKAQRSSNLPTVAQWISDRARIRTHTCLVPCRTQAEGILKPERKSFGMWLPRLPASARPAPGGLLPPSQPTCLSQKWEAAAMGYSAECYHIKRLWLHALSIINAQELK